LSVCATSRSKAKLPALFVNVLNAPMVTFAPATG
jgi:hypothetical protein